MDSIQPFDQGVPPVLIFSFGGIKIVGREVKGSFSCDLTVSGWTETGLPKFQCGLNQLLLLGYQGPNSSPTGTLSLADCIYHDYMVIDPFQMHGTEVTAFITEFPVGFV